jgi:hypothetical protein
MCTCAWRTIHIAFLIILYAVGAPWCSGDGPCVQHVILGARGVGGELSCSASQHCRDLIQMFFAMARAGKVEDLSHRLHLLDQFIAHACNARVGLCGNTQGKIGGNARRQGKAKRLGGVVDYVDLVPLAIRLRGWLCPPPTSQSGTRRGHPKRQGGQAHLKPSSPRAWAWRVVRRSNLPQVRTSGRARRHFRRSRDGSLVDFLS